MADIVQFLVKMQDMVSGPLQKIGQTGELAFGKIQQAVQKLSGKADDLKKSMKQVNDQLDQLQRSRAMGVDNRQIRQISKEIDDLLTKKKKLENGGGSSGSAKGSIGGGLSKLADFGLDSLVSAGKYALQAGMQRQTDLTAFQLKLGKGGGEQVNAGLENMAKNGVYGDGVFAAGEQLANSGVKANNILPAMNMIGNIAAGDKGNLQTLSHAYGDASSTGHLTQPQASMMQSAGFNPLESLSAATHKTLPELQQDLAAGKISMDELNKSMEYATGPAGQYHDAMKKIEQSPTGQLNEFNATINSLAGSIGEALLPVLGVIANVFTALLGNTPLLYGLAGAIGALTAAWAVYTIATEAAAIWTTILDIAALWPIVLIGAIIGLITYLITKYDGWGKSIRALWTIIKSFVDIVILVYKEFFQELIFGFEYVWLKAKSTFEYIGAFISNTIKALNQALHGDFAGAKKTLSANITTEANAQLEVLVKTRQQQVVENSNRVNDNINKIKASAGQIGLSTHGNAKNTNPFAAASPAAVGAIAPGAGGLGVSGAAANSPSQDTAGAISGGGTRNITINVAKFQDKTEIHTMNMRESAQELEDMMRDLFIRVTSSASGMVTAGAR